MVEVGNQLLVLYSKYSDEVEIIEDGHEIYLCDMTHLADKSNSRVRFILKDYIFSGIMLATLNVIVKWHIEDDKDNKVRHRVHDGFIYMEPRDTEYYMFKFYTDHKSWVGNSLSPIFVEKNLEGI